MEKLAWGRVSVDVREWYHVTKLKVSKRAFVSPFGMMEMPTLINVEKEPVYIASE